MPADVQLHSTIAKAHRKIYNSAIQFMLYLWPGRHIVRAVNERADLSAWAHNDCPKTILRNKEAIICKRTTLPL